MSTRDQFLCEVEAYIVGSGMTATEFGLAVLRDGSFVFRLREGKDIRTKTLDQVREWMRARPLARKRRTTEQARSVA